jgi:trk system potassium uptake protein TrkH
MVNFRIIARVFSLLLIFEGLVMLAAAGVSYLYQEHTTSAFIYSSVITIITGVIVFTPLRNEERVSGIKEGYIIVTGIWVLFSLFGTLPYLFTHSAGNFTDAFFESMSGFTTTGASTMTQVESLSHGILFWRSITQWIGGMGIIFISISIFPVVRSINIQMAATEFSGYQIEKINPRTKKAVRRLIFIYAALTFAETLLLFAGGMPFFDAVCHSFSTLSTGGFSTRNNGMAAFSSYYIMAVMTIFMFLAGTNLSLIYFAFKGRFRKSTGRNEFLFYTWLCVVFTVLAAAILFIEGDSKLINAIVNSSFHIVSIITTTGFYTQNFSLWGAPMILIIFILMFTGATAGSTSGGIKSIRLLLLAQNYKMELKRQIHPSAFLPVRINSHLVPQNTIQNILVFLTLYFFIICISTLVMSVMGYDIITSFSTAASMLANIGPALGSFAPFSNYSDLPVFGKWFLSALMLLGRLELLTVMVLFSRSFYRN